MAKKEEEYDGEVVIEEVDAEEFKGDSEKDKLSAVKASQQKAKDYSYYYAHSKVGDGLPPDAVVRETDPLDRADGLGPKKIEEQKGAGKGDDIPENVKWIDDLSYSDDGALVKVYVEFPVNLKDATIRCEYEQFGVLFLATKPEGSVYGIRVKDAEGWVLEHERKNGFAHEIVPEKSSYRISSSGTRITLKLHKQDEKEKWYEIKKQDIRSTFKK